MSRPVPPVQVLLMRPIEKADPSPRPPRTLWGTAANIAVLVASNYSLISLTIGCVGSIVGIFTKEKQN